MGFSSWFSFVRSKGGKGGIKYRFEKGAKSQKRNRTSLVLNNQYNKRFEQKALFPASSQVSLSVSGSPFLSTAENRKVLVPILLVRTRRKGERERNKKSLFPFSFFFLFFFLPQGPKKKIKKKKRKKVLVPILLV
jgi:hypothetical protein